MSRADVKAIRADMATRLSGNTNADERVYTARMLPLMLDDVVDGPSIVVAVVSERHQHEGESPTYDTTTTCTVDCYGTAIDEASLQDLFDDLVAQVEDTLFASDFRDQFDHIASIETLSAAEQQQLDDAIVLFGRVGIRFDLAYKSQFIPSESRPSFTKARLKFDFESGDNPDVESDVEAA